METIDIAISFDQTGSMAPCIRQVARSVENTVDFLFTAIPNIRIGLVAHGDYCDGKDFCQLLDLTSDRDKIIDFIKNAKRQDGGDAPECYEYVLNKARTLNWTAGRNKALVLIGDSIPHEVGYRVNSGGYHFISKPVVETNQLDWKNEARLLHEAGVSIYPVQALGRSSCSFFYDELSNISGKPKLELDQFDDINHLIAAVCLSRADKVESFGSFAKSQSMGTQNVVAKLTGKKVTKAKTALSSYAVHPSRFQVLSVPYDTPIKDFVQNNHLRFNIGRGFYEFTKPVLVQKNKEVIIQDKTTGEMFNGPKAREILGIPSETSKVHPSNFGRYRGFVQSTSNNRKLLKGTKFLYEVDDL